MRRAIPGLAVPACVAALVLAWAGDAAGDPAAPIGQRILAADSARVVRIRVPVSGEVGPPGEDRLDDFIVEREGRADAAWKAGMAEALSTAMSRHPVSGTCGRESGPRRIRFGIQFFREGERITFVVYLAERCFEFWTGRRFEGSARMKDLAPQILSLLKRAFPADTTVRNLDGSGLVSCEDYMREHPGPAPVESPPEIIRLVPPKYPGAAKKARIEGRVLVQVQVEADGSQGEVKVLKSVPELDAAAIAAVRQWRFEPAIDCWGQPIASAIVVPVNFRLE